MCCLHIVRQVLASQEKNFLQAVISNSDCSFLFLSARNITNVWNDFALLLFDFQGVPKWGCLILPFSVGERGKYLLENMHVFFRVMAVCAKI